MRWPVPVAHCARTTGGTVRTTTPSGVSVTVIAKMVFHLVQGDATLAAPEPLVLRDAHADDDDEQSLVRPCEIAPRLPQAEIVVVRASARQPAGQPGTSRAVALAVYRDQTPLLTKMLHVHGDRAATSPQTVKPFTEMPVAWSRSRFEPSVNPFGIRPNDPRLPNVVAPQHPHAPASFEPIPRRAPWRRGMLGGVAAAVADGLEPALPTDFNWEYYQCSTRDQRVPGMTGTEWIVIDGVAAETPRIQCRLPGVRAKARVHARGAAPAELALAIDLVVVDVHAKTIAVVSRGHAAFSEGMSVSVTVEGPGVAAEWPTQADNPPPSQQPKLAYAGTAAANAAPTSETANLSEAGQKEAAAQRTAPFEIAAPKGPSGAGGPAPWQEASKPVVPATIATPMGSIGTSKQTMAISADALRPPSGPPSEVSAPMASPAPPAPPAARPVEPASAPKKETLGERFARGDIPKPVDAPPVVVAPPATVATSTPPDATNPPPVSARAPSPARPVVVEKFGVKRPPPEKKKPLDKSPEAVAERMWRSGVSKEDIEAYLASVKR